MEERTKVVIYARVSTYAQDYTRQITELRKYAKKQNYEIVKEFSEKISGGKKVEERTAIKEMLDFVKFNKVDKVLIYECSRLSRRQLDFLSIIEQLTEAGVSLYILQNGLETLLPDGKPNPIATLCFGIIAEFNTLEKNLIRARMASGYEHHRASGGRVGRKEGYRKSEEEYRMTYEREISLLKKGNTLKDVKSITGTSINTLRKLREKYVWLT
ncbi:MAG: recombinase family protein [Bacteroidales bacterium]|nr:recombinase family protein [Rikenellaceae bacterium]MDD6976406.1 recombinase family protein [Bacteroidales bacterium]MDY6171128.1 recombinase family protein [Candidatus Cryptobacteroides sp.]